MDVAYSLADAVARFMDAGPGLLTMLLCLAIVAIPVALLHELGHAVAARRLLGGEVRVSVGTAGRLAEMRLGQLSMSVNAVGHPGKASGFAEFDGSRATALDVLVIALAGPAASLIGAVLTGWAYSAAPPTGVMHDLLWTATLAGVFGFLNLVPLTLREGREGAIVRTDGRLALDAIRVVRAMR